MLASDREDIVKMDNIKVEMQVDPNEDTEWNDILRSKGIIPERPPSPTAELEAALEEAVKKQEENRLETKDLDELDELEDEEDEGFLNVYKQRRMAELQELQQRLKFGSVFPIDKKEYEQQVTLALEGAFVLLHMSLQSSLQSRLLASIFTTAASKYPEIKFCDIVASRCVENYPDSNCPTILIYHNKDMVKQYVTLAQLGGNDANIKDIEKILVDLGAVEHHDKRLCINQQDEDQEESRRLRFAKKSVRGKLSLDQDDDDDYFD